MSLQTLETVSGVSKKFSAAQIENLVNFDALHKTSARSAWGVDALMQSSSVTEQLLVDFQDSLATIDMRLKDSHTSTRRDLELSSPCHMILYPPNTRFYGREDILSHIATALTPESTEPKRLQSFALYGMPGVGKTQTALRYVYQHLENYRIILWIAADTEDKILQGFADAARQLEIIVLSSDQYEHFKEVRTWLEGTGKFHLQEHCSISAWSY